MIPNIDPDNGVAYGYISMSAIGPEMAYELMSSSFATNHTYEAALAEHLAIERRAEYEAGRFDFNQDWHIQQFDETWKCDEPIIEGYMYMPGGIGSVHFRSIWQGGALHFFILSSPYITDRARRAPLCVLNAGMLDTLDGNVTAYDVPADWRVR